VPPPFDLAMTTAAPDSTHGCTDAFCTLVCSNSLPAVSKYNWGASFVRAMNSRFTAHIRQFQRLRCEEALQCVYAHRYSHWL
jgi:hypothetical protein